MKYLKLCFLIIAVSVLGGNAAFAQDEITDDDLRKYAILTQVVEYMKKDISIETNKMIKAQEGMTGQRYVELASAKGDQAKLDAMEAKDYEIQFIALVDELKEDRIEAIKTVNSELATKMVGDKGKIYKQIKEELASDEALNARYEAILAQIVGE